MTQKYASLAMSLSISALVQHPGLNAGNFGGRSDSTLIPAVELMVINSCDRLIASKKKWISALVMLSPAAKRLKRREIEVVMEDEDNSTVVVCDDSVLLQDYVTLEKDMFRNCSMFTNLVWRYDLVKFLPSEYTEGMIYGEPLRWDKVSFLRCRKFLLQGFITRKTALGARPVIRIEKQKAARKVHLQKKRRVKKNTLLPR